MSNLPEHIVLNDQRQYQLTIDKENVGVIEAKYPVKKSKGRPYLLRGDDLKVDRAIEALEKVESNYES